MIALVRWISILGLIIGAPLLVFLSARAFEARNSWTRVVKQLEKSADEVEQELLLTRDGGAKLRYALYDTEHEVPTSGATPDERVGLKQLRQANARWAFMRGRTWRATPGAIDPAQPITIQINAPVELAVNEKSFVYLFDSRDFANGGRYLGEFAVTSVTVVEADPPTQTITVIPSDTFSPSEMQLLQASAAAVAASNNQAFWLIHETMPSNRHTVAAAEPVDPAAPATPPADENAPPSLKNVRDYVGFFRLMRAKRPELIDALVAITNDAQSFRNATMGLTKQAEARATTEAMLMTDKATATTQRDEVAKALDALMAEVQQLAKDNQSRFEANRALGQEIVQSQLDAMKRAVPAVAVQSPR